MRRCLQCGVENLELARFCSNCGSPLSVVRPKAEQPAVAPISPELPRPIAQDLSRQSAPGSARLPVQEPYYPPPMPQRVARSNEQSPFVSEKPFSAPRSAASLPVSPFVPLSRNQPEVYPQYSNPAYAPTIPHSVPSGLSPLATSPVKKKRRLLLFALLVGIFTVLILAVAGLFLLLSTDKQPKLSVIQGQPVPGQQILLQGEHFPVGSKISLVVDTGLLVSSPGINSLLVQSTLIPVSSTETSGVVYRAVVGSDGTFTLKIRIPRTWKSGSQHTIVAEVAGTNAQQVKPVQYQITIA